MTIESTSNISRPEPRWGQRGTAGALIAGQLSFEQVSYAIAGKTIVRDVSFTMEPGEIICLLGPSGCGKTTLLRLAAGIISAGSGRILLDGREIDGPSICLPPEQRNLGLVFQDFALFPAPDSRSECCFRLHQLERGEALKIATLALQRVGLESLRDAYPGSLSGGEQQRVALARAIVPRPKVMLLDEPFSGLDQRLRESVRTETLTLLKETRASCILVTHDPVEALEFSDRIMLMRAGRLVQVGRPMELYEHPFDLEAARFFSDINEIPGTVGRDGIETSLGTFPLSSPLGIGQSAVAVIRPEGIRLSRQGEQGVEALVRERRYLGETYRLLLQFSGVEAEVSALIHGKAPERGETALFRFDAGKVLTFTKSPGDRI